MEVFIKVVAMDHDAGLKCTEKRTIKVPGAVIKMHEMFSREGPANMVRTIATAVMIGAMKELDARRRNRATAMDEQLGSSGRVGGSSSGGRMNPMEEALGLDVIQAMNGTRRAPQAPQAPQPGMPPQPTVPMTPAPMPMPTPTLMPTGPAEFGGGGPGQQMGPGPCGFPKPGTRGY